MIKMISNNANVDIKKRMDGKISSYIVTDHKLKMIISFEWITNIRHAGEHNFSMYPGGKGKT